MSNAGKFQDKSPLFREAGVTTAISGQSADNSIRQDVYFKPKTSTPEHIKKYRRSLKEVPGVKQIHYGIFNDPKDYEQMVHGVKTQKSDHVPDCIKGGNLNGINYFMNEIKEDKYASHKREPLGTSILRNYDFPERVKNEDFKFGVPTVGCNYPNLDYSSKDLIYPPNGNLAEDYWTKKKYYITHGLTDPGEQKDRNYRLNFDKHNHVYGLYQPLEKDGCKNSLRPDLLMNQYPKTLICDKRLEDFRQATADVVGKPRFKGTMPPELVNDHTFGVKTMKGNNWNVGKCLSGDPEGITQKHLEPDVDLGKSFNYRSKNRNLIPKSASVGGISSNSDQTAEESKCSTGKADKLSDSNRVFGVPSIRTDLKPKEQRSVTDMNVLRINVELR